MCSTILLNLFCYMVAICGASLRHQSLQYVLSISSFSCKPLADLDSNIISYAYIGRLIKQNFRYGNENIECVSNCKYLGIWFSSSGSYSFVQNELYKKSLKAFFKLKFLDIYNLIHIQYFHFHT
jgi:hypothetical protein